MSIGATTDQFGYWLSGFVDGEGCFYLGWKQSGRGDKRYRAPLAYFVIVLRDDDAPIVRDVQSYLGVGFITTISTKRHARNDMPSVRLTVENPDQLANVIIPLFEKYPLRAKKARDFPLWRAGVEFITRIRAEPLVWEPGARGHTPRWTPDRLAEFQQHIDALKGQRKYAADTFYRASVSPVMYTCGLQSSTTGHAP